METKLTWLNSGNKTAEIQVEYLRRVMSEFTEPIHALEIGCAYGGGVEAMARILGDRGTAYGFDTFEGHPKDLAIDKGGKEATCMDHWYQPHVFGIETLDIEYQRSVLKKENIKNAILVKGRVNKDSFKMIDKAHFVLMDLDLISSTRSAYEGIKDKIVKGGYFIMHDSLPFDHLPEIHKFVYEEMMKEGEWYIEKESIPGLSTTLKRK